MSDLKASNFRRDVRWIEKYGIKTYKTIFCYKEKLQQQLVIS